MKDLIAERDRKEKMDHSIVKWWNVHYMTKEELEVAQGADATVMSQDRQSSKPDVQPHETHVAPDEETLDAAQEIIDRLRREAEEDEARKQHEIEQAKLVAEGNFNQSTGAYSGMYGADGADGEYSEQIHAILAEKDDALRELIEHTEEM